MSTTAPVTTFVADKLTQPLKNVFMWSAIIAGVFFLVAILLFVALFTRQSTFAKVITVIAFLLILAQAIVVTMFAVYVNNLTNRINNAFATFNQKATAFLFGGKLINALLGKKVVNEETGEPLVEEPAITGAAATEEVGKEVAKESVPAAPVLNQPQV